ncbi:hypothetical protein BH09PAT4_BH09PAT4_01600 [soil metagenome]
MIKTVMLIDFIILLVCGSTIALLGILILIRNPSQTTNRRFAYLALMLLAWTSLNFMSDHAKQHILLYTRLTFLAGVLAIYAVALFMSRFPSNNSQRSELLSKIYGTVTLLLVPIVFLPGFLTSVSIAGEIKTGPLYGLFIGYIFLSVCVLLITIQQQKSRVRVGSQRQQLSTISAGVVIYAILVLGSNVFLPALVNNWSSSRFGPAFTLFLVGVVAYTIVKHQLFDIRLIIARSVGYVGSVAILAALYGFIVFSLTKVVFSLDLSLSVQIFLSLATGVAGLLFQKLNQPFNKLTNQLFYRDAYDPQALFGRLNSMLVTSLDMKYLMTQSVLIIEETIKPDFALVGLGGIGEEQRVFARKKLSFPKEEVERVKRLTGLMRSQKVVVADYLDSPAHAELREIMQKNGIAVIVRLTQNTRTHEDGFGYLVLGVKKSGNPYTQQDVGVLDTVGNELTIAIQNTLHYEEIQRFNLVLQKRVDEATRKLRRTNEKLKALDETKDDFISMASHQLRTPLTSVKGYLSMVLEGDAGKINATQQKMLGQAFTSSQRMVYLIADLLNVSRLRTGKFVIEAAPTNLALMIEEELAQLVEAAKVRDLELTFDKPKDPPELMLDETKTRQVIMNFIDNAIYYTPSGGHIKVELKSDDRKVELRVIDDGIGVPKAEQHHLFTKFYRAGNARKARPDGTGLGLFMAKKVVIAQGGSVIFESTEGKGSVFGFSFSRRKLAPSDVSSDDKPSQERKLPIKTKA